MLDDLREGGIYFLVKCEPTLTPKTLQGGFKSIGKVVNELPPKTIKTV